jgi:hypothetical protein
VEVIIRFFQQGNIDSNMQQQNVKEFDNKSRRKTKGKMFRNSMLGSINTYWIHEGNGHGILRLDLHRKNLWTYFM